MLTVLSGGTGTPKLLQGLAHVVPMEEISVIVNTGEDVEVSGLYVSPDVDSVVYSMGEIIDEDVWYGIEGDTFSCYEMLRQMGHDEMLRIGDKDRGIKMYRSLRLCEGASLSRITKEVCQNLGVNANIMPMSDDRVITVVDTEEGPMSFHEFWVVRRAEDKVVDVNFLHANEATPAPGVVEAIEEAHSVVIGPSNPVTSIGPILAIEGIRSALKRNREKISAISPVLGNAPVSGPTGVLMRGLGLEVSPVGVAKIYRDVVNNFMLHRGDRELSQEIESLGMSVFIGDLMMPDLNSRVELARRTLQCLDYPMK